MQQEYHHILTLLFEHQYFENNLLESLRISFADETSKLIQDLNTIVKPFPGGLHLLMSNTELFDTFDDTVPVRLYLSTSDNLFFNYTDLPAYNIQDNLLYFNNLSSSGIDSSDSFLLHTNDFAGVNEVVELSDRSIDISSLNPTRKFQLSDTAGNEIYSQTITEFTPPNQYFNTQDLPEGIYTISIDDVETKRFYHSAKTVWQKPIAVFELYLGTLLTQYKNKGKVDYCIRFKSLQTFWKYFLVSPVYEKFNSLSIINKEKEQIFSTPQKQFIQSNSEVLVFKSKNRIPISEHTKPTFQLIDKFDSKLKTGKVVIKNLPGASADQLFYDESKSDEAIYSHIYI